nr:PQQ-like beta-propeller repeat protein [Streptomyces coryli]
MSFATCVGGAVGADADGKPLVYTVAQRDNDLGTFYVVDAATGALRHRFDLGRGASSYGVAVAPDGTVYVAATGTGKLHRLRPGGDTLDDLGRLFPSESHLYKLAFDDDGNVYGGTYPNGKVFRYDPATGDVHDYGQAAAGQAYVRSVGRHRGTVYAGTQPHAHLVAIDAATGVKQDLALPDGTDPDQVVYDINIVGDLLFTRLTKTGLTGTLLVRDLAAGTWKDQIKDVAGLDVTQLDETGKVYFSQRDTLMSYDPATRELAPTSLAFTFTSQLRSLGFGTLAGQPDFPGQSVIGMIWTGEIFWHNPQSGKSKLFASQVEGNPVRVRSLSEAPDGRIVTGGTGTGSVGFIDPETGKGDTHRFSEVMGSAAHQGAVYLGAYPRGRVYAYDPAKPWAWNNIDDAGKVNPAEVYNGDASYGDRPFAMASLPDGRLAVGTVNKSGYLGGSLILHDPATGRNTEHTGLVKDQSIMALAHAGGVLYVGTSVYGGYGATEPQTDARLFAWDVEAGRKLWEITPVEGERTVSSLTFDGRGVLWGATAGVLFRCDPASRKVASRRLAPYEWPVDGGYALADLRFNPRDKHLYGTMPNLGLYRLKPPSWKPEVLTARPVYRMLLHSSGDVFAGDGAELLRWRAGR